MSLLQDALRKAQNEGGGGHPPDLPSHASKGPGCPPVRERRVVTRAALVVVLLMVGGAVFFAVHSRYGGASGGQTPSADPPIAVPSPSPSSIPAPAVSPVLGVPDGETKNAGAAAFIVRTTPSDSGLAPVRRDAGGKGAAASGRRFSPKEKSRGTPASGAAVPREVPASVPSQDPVFPGAEPEWLSKYNGAVQAQRQGDWETSARLFQEAISSNPALIEGWNGLGISLVELGEYAEAENAFRKALTLDPEYPAALVNAGLLRMREGRIKEAAGMFERAVVIEPRWSAARVNLAIAQARQGRDRDAETTLLAARRIIPDDPDVLYHLGMALERKGDRFAAGKIYSEFLTASAGRYPYRERLVADRLRDWDR